MWFISNPFLFDLWGSKREQNLIYGFQVYFRQLIPENNHHFFLLGPSHELATVGTVRPILVSRGFCQSAVALVLYKEEEMQEVYRVFRKFDNISVLLHSIWVPISLTFVRGAGDMKNVSLEQQELAIKVVHTFPNNFISEGCNIRKSTENIS